MRDVIVIGAGASGLMAGIEAAKAGCSVLILEKMAACGRKIRITGKGRCNVTTTKNHDEIFAAIRRNPKFMYSSLAAFDNKDVWQFFESRGCALKEERGERVFPVSDKAQDIVDVLVKEAKKCGCEIQCDTYIKKLAHNEETGFVLEDEAGKAYGAKAVIVCTGGASYPTTGSSGDAYPWMEALGVKVEPVSPALVPLVSKEEWVHALQGLSLRNVALTITNDKGKVFYHEQGEMLFTHFGISGPIVLSASGHCSDYWKKNKKHLEASIDLKPALSEAQLDNRLLREIAEIPNKQVPSLVRKLLPQKMVPIFIKKCGIKQDKVLHQLSKEERNRIIKTLKDFSFSLSGTRPLSEGIVTAGGISVKEVQPKTLAIKKVPGLFAAGEVIDIDAYTGGFNLQIAFSTGYCAGRAAAAYVLEGSN